ncbi:hypothetical protein HPP92_023273 [Vanilla planifolia]|uniref:Uncharacterized protein n=1 Tax=Vanilla planifolia TaxID=51239 RepID=A0A835PTT9_VANPL|nr:hypothetical protein HPP92_023273 [Vanilla planifolia]
MGEFATAAVLEKQLLTAEEEEAERKSLRKELVAVQPRPKKGLVSSAVDLLERFIFYIMHDSSKPLHYLSGNFAPIRDETPPSVDLPVRGYLPVRIDSII